MAKAGCREPEVHGIFFCVQECQNPILKKRRGRVLAGKG